MGTAGIPEVGRVDMIDRSQHKQFVWLAIATGRRRHVLACTASHLRFTLADHRRRAITSRRAEYEEVTSSTPTRRRKRRRRLIVDIRPFWLIG